MVRSGDLAASLRESAAARPRGASLVASRPHPPYPRRGAFVFSTASSRPPGLEPAFGPALRRASREPRDDEGESGLYGIKPAVSYLPVDSILAANPRTDLPSGVSAVPPPPFPPCVRAISGESHRSFTSFAQIQEVR